MADASFAVAQEPPWSPWRDAALCLCAEAHLLIGDVDRAAVLFAESATLAADDVQYRFASSSASPSSRCWRWIADDGRRRPSTWNVRSMPSTSIGCTTTPPACSPSPPRPGSPCTAATRRRRTASSRKRCGPVRLCTFVMPFLAVRLRLQLAKVYRATGDATTARHLLKEIDDVLLHRPDLGALVDEVDEFRQILTSSAQAGPTGGAPLSPAELRLLPVPADAPDGSRDRRAAVRLPQHRQLRDRLDLPQAGRLLTQRRRAAGDGGRPARRVADVTARTGISNASSMSYPSASANFGAAATTLGIPTTGTTPTSTSTISAAVAPAPTAASACAP